MSKINITKNNQPSNTEGKTGGGGGFHSEQSITPWGELKFFNRVEIAKDKVKTGAYQIAAKIHIKAGATGGVIDGKEVSSAEYMKYIHNINDKKIVTSYKVTGADGIARTKELPEGEYILQFAMPLVNSKGVEKHLTVMDEGFNEYAVTPRFDTRTVIDGQPNTPDTAEARLSVIKFNNTNGSQSMQLEGLQLRNEQISVKESKESSGGSQSVSALKKLCSDLERGV